MTPTATDFLSYTLTAGLVAGVGLATPRLLRIRDAEARSTIWAWTWVAAFLAPLLPAIPQTGWAVPAAFEFSVEAAAAALPARGRWWSGAWLAGAALLAAWRLCGLARLIVWRRESSEISTEQLEADLAGLPGRDRVRFFVSPQAPGPLTFGRSTVLLPEDFLALPPADRRAILAHELAHVERRDGVRLLVWEAARTPLWFHPAAHLLLNRLTAAREQIVDRRAAALVGRRSYLETLARTAACRALPPLVPAPLFLNRVPLVTRMRALVEDRPMSRWKRRSLILGSGLTLAALALAVNQSFTPASLAKEPEVFKVGPGIQAPRLLSKVEPAYSEEAREAKLEGTVIVDVEIHPDGRAYNARVREGVGMGLNEKAVEAIDQWRFAPAVKDGQPVAVSATIEVNFRLL